MNRNQKIAKMTQAERSRQTEVKIKNIIDTIYDNTKEPMKKAFKSFGPRVRAIATMLIKRHVVVNDGNAMVPVWRWNSDLAPTDTLYKTIIQDYRDYYSGVNSRYRNKQKEVKKEEPATPDEAVPTIRKATIKDYSAQDLWNELKSRGYMIVEGKLVRYEWLS